VIDGEDFPPQFAGVVKGSSKTHLGDAGDLILFGVNLAGPAPRAAPALIRLRGFWRLVKTGRKRTN